MEKKRINLFLPAKMVDDLDEKATEMGLNRTSLMTVIIKQYLDQQQALGMIDKIKDLESLVKLSEQLKGGGII